jgi:carboxyl-terminal processing protease
MPAESAGVEAGDLILNIKDEQKGIDESTVNITLPEAVEKIRGPKGSTVILTLLHEDESEPFDAQIKRDTIVVPSVEVEFKDNIAHLKLMRFGELTAQQWDNSVQEIINQQPVGVILDVRSNPGGFLKGSINLASEFLPQGVIVKQEDYQARVETYSVNRKGRLISTPLVVLIDRGSASASEILAGALQDQGRGQLVGTNSFGKGTIQESEELEQGAGIHITTAKWLTPNGRWVDGEGLKPDIEIEDNKDTEEDEQLQRAIELLTEDR